MQAAKDFKPDLFIWAGYAQDALPSWTIQGHEVLPPIYLGAPPAWPVDMGKSPLAENVMLYGMSAPGSTTSTTVSKRFYDAYVAANKTPPTTTSRLSPPVPSTSPMR